jgi:hypothetical protein
MSRDPKDLTEQMQGFYARFKAKMDAEGQRFILTATYRPQVEQDALYAQGRLSLKEVNGFQVFYEYQDAKETEAINRRQETFSYRLDKIERALQNAGIGGRTHGREHMKRNILVA